MIHSILQQVESVWGSVIMKYIAVGSDSTAQVWCFSEGVEGYLGHHGSGFGFLQQAVEESMHGLQLKRDISCGQTGNTQRETHEIENEKRSIVP